MEYTEMKDRIAHIIRAKNLTAAEFAQQLGIQPSNVSHLLAGRNNPSLEFVKKLKETFPEYNLDWVVLGNGPMTVSAPFVDPKSDFETVPKSNESIENEEDTFAGTLFASPEASTPGTAIPPVVSQIDLKRIILVYSDNSFEILSPR